MYALLKLYKCEGEQQAIDVGRNWVLLILYPPLSPSCCLSTNPIGAGSLAWDGGAVFPADYRLFPLDWRWAVREGESDFSFRTVSQQDVSHLLAGAANKTVVCKGS
jgi:hypothetical protein